MHDLPGKLKTFKSPSAISLYKYIVYKGAEKEWGDGIRGLYLTTARYALYQIPPTDIHTKNYRPQLLVFCKFNEKRELENGEIISIARHLKAGKGRVVNLDLTPRLKVAANLQQNHFLLI